MDEEDTGCLNVINRAKRHMVGVDRTIGQGRNAHRQELHVESRTEKGKNEKYGQTCFGLTESLNTLNLKFMRSREHVLPGRAATLEGWLWLFHCLDRPLASL